MEERRERRTLQSHFYGTAGGVLEQVLKLRGREMAGQRGRMPLEGGVGL